ncbi:MAG: copper resistance protein B [Geobacteraceae bacterium]|nr:copper resistance protein B [Geobacteraceae bacterium]
MHTNPVVGEGIQKYAEDAQEGAQRNFGVQVVHDNMNFATFNAHRLEYIWSTEGSDEVLVWDVAAWAGDDYNKIYLKSEGEALIQPQNKVEEFNLELLYSRNINRFWDVQLGVRYDFEPTPERSFLALGLQGLAPQWIETDLTAYLSEDGDASVALEMEYELLITQRLVLVPRLEAGLSFNDVPEYEQWRGITHAEIGMRLMYHLKRKFAPYVGVSWHKLLGKTANRVEAMGGDSNDFVVLTGVHFWF